MADFDLTQTDAQVQSILNDAQDAMGAGAQTTLTTDYVMLKDTNGRYHKILKDSLTEACRNVLADLLVNNDKGTTISQIAAIDSGDFGSVTQANLASVLGGVTNGVASPFSFSIHHSGDCRNVTNSPVSYGVIMKCTLAYYPVWMAFSSTSEGVGAFLVGIADHNQNELANVSWKKIQFAS